eukprot:1885987-Prymnesium_polylepis.1
MDMVGYGEIWWDMHMARYRPKNRLDHKSRAGARRQAAGLARSSRVRARARARDYTNLKRVDARGWARVDTSL